MSMPLSRSSAAIHALVRSMLSSPQSSKPTEVTVASCSCSLSVRNSGSISSTRSSSKARIPITCSSATDAFWHRRIGANLLISRSRFSSRCRSASSGTKSTLLSRRRSAKATCSTASFSAPSGFSSSRCCSMCFASTSVTIASSRACSLMDSSMKKVCATCSGGGDTSEEERGGGGGESAAGEAAAGKGGGRKGGCADRPGVSESRRLDHHGVEPVAPLEELGEDADEVTAYRAADAAVVHLEDVLGCLVPLLHERVINANVAKLILDHRDPLAVVGCQNVVEQGGLPAPKEAGEYRHWD
mmetsp:Transcript_24243/g.79818  ORF Transcript_24243/g.79818 Transcript_24243/m.79818 type:complete len:300 (-) Transcript_24243:91-990(-)